MLGSVLALAQVLSERGAFGGVKSEEISIINQNQFIYFGGFTHLVYYNLIVCYSLDPVLVIWYVSLVIFWKFNDIYLN